VSSGQGCKEAVAATERSARARSRLGEEGIDAWKGRSRRWSGDNVERWPGELYWRRETESTRTRSETEEREGARRKIGD
jgi:hypothetical protein